MARKSEYNFGKECESGGMNEGFALRGCSTSPKAQCLNCASLQKKIDICKAAFEYIKNDRDRLLQERRCGYSRINQDRTEEHLNECEGQHRTEEELNAVKKDLADKDKKIQGLEMKLEKERKLGQDENELPVRKKIRNCERSNDDLNQEESNKMDMLPEWENKFDLKQENAKLHIEINLLKSQMFRLTSQSSSSLVNCFSCGIEFDPDDSQENDCHYHPLPPMGYTQWRRWPMAEKVDHHCYHTYQYYTCCNTLSRKRPKGCIVGRHHINWNIDLCAVFRENGKFVETDEQPPKII